MTSWRAMTELKQSGLTAHKETGWLAGGWTEVWTVHENNQRLARVALMQLGRELGRGGQRGRVLVDALLYLGTGTVYPRQKYHAGGPRGALRWYMRQLAKSSVYTELRLDLESRARESGHGEPELLACWHANGWEHCSRLLELLEGGRKG